MSVPARGRWRVGFPPRQYQQDNGPQEAGVDVIVKERANNTKLAIVYVDGQEEKEVKDKGKCLLIALLCIACGIILIVSVVARGSGCSESTASLSGGLLDRRTGARCPVR